MLTVAQAIAATFRAVLSRSSFGATAGNTRDRLPSLFGKLVAFKVLGFAAWMPASACVGSLVSHPENDGSVTLSDGGVSTDAFVRPDVDIVPLPPGSGWAELPDTKIRTVCPPDQVDGAAGVYEFSFHCNAVTSAWSSAIADAQRGQLIVWGGGHNDYYGNELYMLDLSTRKMTRLNEPTIPTQRNDIDTCAPQIPPGSGGSPNGRHTYGTLVHVAHADKMFAYSGSLSCGGGHAGQDTWTLDLATLRWQRMDPVSGEGPHDQLGSIADYDPTSELVYVLDRSGLYSYDVDSNTYSRLHGDVSHGLNTHGVIDPRRQLFITAGPDALGKPTLGFIDLKPGSTYTRVDHSSDALGCPAMAVRNPGMAYEPRLDAIVIWGGGDTVDVFDPDTRTCRTMGGPGGPGPQVANGTYGRFRYLPTHGVFAVVNGVDQNAYTLRLSE